MNKRLKILISCYACNPNRGSEPGMGWNFVHGLSAFNDVHVIVEKEKCKEDIEAFLKKHPNKNLHFYYISKKRNRLLRTIWPPSYYWYYRDWQKKAYELSVQLNEKENFDLIHQLNMVGYREPGFLWKIDKPFVWGPIGGTENIPWHLFSLFNIYGKVFYGGRNILNSIQRNFLKRPKQAAVKKVSALIAATPDIKKSIKSLWNKDAKIITEVGSVGNTKTSINKRKDSEPLKIVWSGQHTSGKALPILLESLKQVKDTINWELHILGIGKETEAWKKMAKKYQLDSKCVWYGWLKKEEALKVMKNAHTLAITSLKDLTSSVIVEGISLGLPVVTLDHCGFSYVVDETCGIKISVERPDQIFKSFQEAFVKLYNDEKYRQKLAKGAFDRSSNFSWDKKVNMLNNIYRDLVA